MVYYCLVKVGNGMGDIPLNKVGPLTNEIMKLMLEHDDHLSLI